MQGNRTVWTLVYILELSGSSKKEKRVGGWKNRRKGKEKRGGEKREEERRREERRGEKRVEGLILRALHMLDN